MYACLDLGSNSFHLLIARSGVNGIEVVERLSEKVQLGEGVTATGRLSPAAFQRGIDCLHRFRDVIHRHRINCYWALGTNALRVAANADEFIAAARVAGFEVHAISGELEARLIYAGVLSALPASSERRLVIDIGGGSTELIAGQGSQPGVIHSLAVGCVSWRDRWFQNAASTEQDIEQRLTEATRAAAAVFERVASEFTAHQHDNAYASSGTAKMLAAVCSEMGFSSGLIEIDGMRALKANMIQSVLRGELLPGVSELRRELILPGWAILMALMETLQLEKINFSASALREGMLEVLISNRCRSPSSADFPPVTTVMQSHE